MTTEDSTKNTLTTAQMRMVYITEGAHLPAAKAYDHAEASTEFDRWLNQVKSEAAREALTGLAVEMERLDSDRIEAESANLPPDTIGTSDTIRRAENMHEEPWEFVYEHIDSDAYLENLDLEPSIAAELADKLADLLKEQE